MKAIDLHKELGMAIAEYGENIDIVIQDSPTGTHPECCKHEHFFIVAELKGDITNPAY